MVSIGAPEWTKLANNTKDYLHLRHGVRCRLDLEGRLGLVLLPTLFPLRLDCKLQLRGRLANSCPWANQRRQVIDCFLVITAITLFLTIGAVVVEVVIVVEQR